MPKAYPIYDSGYAQALATIRDFLETQLPDLQVVGRNGMHKYSNQDHSMYTAMLAVQNIHGARHDLWRVNADPEYHEEMCKPADPREQTRVALAGTQPRVPRHVLTPKWGIRHDC